MKISKGTTRIVIFIGKLAFKIPILNKSLTYFIKGWLGNVDERNIWRDKKDRKLCPIYFSLFGLVNIMPRALPITDQKFNKQWIIELFKELDIQVDVCNGWKNFGYIDTRIVIIDYATCRESTDACYPGCCWQD